MTESDIESAIATLEAEMPDLQNRHRDLFSYANAWAERHDAIIGATPLALRAGIAQRLNRIGVRWGVTGGVRLTSQFPALKPVPDKG